MATNYAQNILLNDFADNVRQYFELNRRKQSAEQEIKSLQAHVAELDKRQLVICDRKGSLRSALESLGIPFDENGMPCPNLAEKRSKQNEHYQNDY